MAHILFAAPEIERFHLHERLARALHARGHRTSVLCRSDDSHAFWGRQGLRAIRAPQGATTAPLPIAEFATIDCALHGIATPGLRQLERMGRPLSDLSGGLLHLFEIDPPDLVLFHNCRSGFHRLVHYLAREVGSMTLWTGDGLLPNTVQIDEEGLDGDAATLRRCAGDYRDMPFDEPFLAAALSAFIGRVSPVPVARATIHPPRLGSFFGELLAGRPFWKALQLKQRAETPRVGLRPTRIDLPNRPFLTVLLQDANDPRLLLDAPQRARPSDLVIATKRAAEQLEANMPIVVVLPEQGLPRPEMRRIASLPGVRLELATAAPEAITTAVAVTTVNHPLAVAALLAGTPTLHTGRALYGMRGVTIRTGTDVMPFDIAGVVGDYDAPTLRGRFLTWLLMHGHLWCTSDAPDHNGLSGFVREIEERLLRGSVPDGQLRYRAGPAWPLAVES